MLYDLEVLYRQSYWFDVRKFEIELNEQNKTEKNAEFTCWFACFTNRSDCIHNLNI